MRAIKKYFAIFLTGLCFMTAVSGCAQEIKQNEAVENNKPEIEENAVISFSWWGKDPRHDYTLKGIEVFEELYPGVRVSANYSGWDGYPKDYEIKINSGNEEDVMQINYSWLQKYSSSGTGYYNLRLLKDYIDLSGYSDEELELGKCRDILNAVPLALNSLMLYYNKPVYDKFNAEIPNSWEDLFTAAQQMNQKAYPLALDEKSCWMLLIAHEEQLSGKRIMGERGALLFTEENFEHMIDFYCELIDKGITPAPKDFSTDDIANGLYAGYMGWVSAAEDCGSKASDNPSDIIIGDYPVVKDAKNFGWYIKPAVLYAIKKNTKYPKAAAAFLDFLINNSQMAKLQGIEKGVPLSDNVKDYIDMEKMPIQSAADRKMQDNVDRLQKQTPYLEDEHVMRAFFDGCYRIYYDTGNKSIIVKEIVKNIENKINEYAGK